MKLSWKPVTLDLRTPFRIAHSVSYQRHNVVVQIGDGLGEAAAVAHHGETQSGIIDYLAKIEQLIWDPFLLEDMLKDATTGFARSQGSN